MPSPEEIAKLKELIGGKLGREPLYPIGECFDSTGEMMLGTAIDIFQNVQVCHGIGESNVPGCEKKIIGHSWIEGYRHGRLYALDTTWGVATDAARYTCNMRLTYVVKYHKKEFFRLWKKHDYSGPWDSKIKAVMPENQPMEGIK